MLYVVVVENDGFLPSLSLVSLFLFVVLVGFDLVRFGEVVGVVREGWLIGEYYYDYIL